MTLKPKKHSERKKIEEKLKHKANKMNTLHQLPPYTMIVSEGVKTEPLYLKGLIRQINSQYKNLTREDHIVVYGTGRNTQNLLNLVYSNVRKGIWDQYEKFWLVYDKDDFLEDNFDNTQFAAEAQQNINIRVAWSNESIELWFLLHFQDYTANNGREQYIELLNKYIDYSKTREDLYEILTINGSLEDAKRRAKKLYNGFLRDDVTSPSEMVPATRMFELIEELEKYLHK